MQNKYLDKQICFQIKLNPVKTKSGGNGHHTNLKYIYVYMRQSGITKTNWSRQQKT